MNKEESSKAKDQAQKEGLGAWWRNGAKGTLQMVTGAGKTYTGIRAINGYAILTKKDKYTMKVLILCPTEMIRDTTWKNEFYDWKERKLYETSVTTVCMQTAESWTNTHWDLVICDEIHNYLTPLKLEFFKNNTYNAILGLSAYIPQEQIPALNTIAPIVYTLTSEEAKKRGIISDYIQYAIPVELTEKENEQYKAVQEKIDKAYANHPHYKTMDFLDLPGYMKKYINERKTILYNAHNKISVVKELIDIFPDRNAAIFTMYTAQADAIKKSVGDTCVVMHNKRTDDENADAIKRLLDKRTKVSRIVSCKALKEGWNVPSLSLIVISSGDSKIRNFVQFRGRGVRFEEDKLAIVILLYVPKTKDEDWLYAKTRDSKTVRLKDIDELKRLYNDIDEEKEAS